MKKNILICLCIIILNETRAQTCPGTGAINYQQWNGISGTAVSNLTSHPNYPNNPTSTGTRTSLEMPTNSGNNIGIRMNGYICPPTNGNYVFWIASDASGELWLSTSSDPANKVRIAFNTNSTKYREWNKYASQKSAVISLVSGQLYYVEVLMKESTGNDNLSVGWAKPGQSTSTPSEVVPGTSLLAQLPDTIPPSTPVNLNAIIITQTSFRLKWDPASDNVGVAGYDVYRNGVKVNGSLIPNTYFDVTGLTANTLYTMTVIAKDAAGNSSPASLPLLVTTLLNTTGNEAFSMRTVISNQRMPHDLVYGPDNKIWYTERFAGTVSNVDPLLGTKTTVLTLGPLMVRTGGQDGLMGLALHPHFLLGKPYVYISYTYESTSSTMRKTRIARYTYNFLTQTLESPETVLENIPGSNDHNAARIAIGPDLKLYYSVGDMGAGQFDNINRPNNSQNTSIYEGKILRLNTEPDSSGSWMPTNNPFGNAVYSLGHRNPQGLVWGNVNGVDILYSDEHGPFSDDEINTIENGRNYGWPNVIGWCDGNYNGRTTGGFTIVNEQTNCNALNVKEPVRSLFPSTNPPSGGDNMTWPSVGHSGSDFYGNITIPGWQNSLLIANLKKGTVSRYKLSNDGQSIISDTIHYFRGLGRFRDVVVSPDGLRIYVACDSSGSTSGPTGGNTTTPANPGSILEFTYLPLGRGYLTQATDKPVPADIITDRSLDVFPNPASQFIVVYNYSQETTRMATLYDLNGRMYKQVQLHQKAVRINIEELPAGLYLLRVSNDKGKSLRTEKIIVAR